MPSRRTRSNRKEDWLILLASLSSGVGIPGIGAYSTTPSAVLGMPRTFPTELTTHRPANAMALNWIHSKMLCRVLDGDDACTNTFFGRTSIQRSRSPRVNDHAAVCYVLEATRFVTDACLRAEDAVSEDFDRLRFTRTIWQSPRTPHCHENARCIPQSLR